MNSHNTKLLTRAYTVQTMLRDCGIHSIIAGGFPRDVHFGLDAKDVDVCTLGFKADRDVEKLHAFQDLLDEEAIEWHTYDFGESDEEYNSEDVHQVYMVISLPELSVDVIFYQDLDGVEGVPTKTAKDLFAQFDCTLNHFYVDYHQNLQPFVVFEGEFNPHSGVVKIQRDVDTHRVNKMLSKVEYLVEHGHLPPCKFITHCGEVNLIENVK